MPSSSTRTSLVLLALVGFVEAAVAQPYYPQPPGYRPPPGRGLGYNCETVTPGTLFAPPTSFSCPLPRRRPLGALCVCNAPPAYGNEIWEGHVVP